MRGAEGGQSGAKGNYCLIPTRTARIMGKG